MKLFINSFRSWIAWATVAMLLLSVVWTYISKVCVSTEVVGYIRSIIVGSKFSLVTFSLTFSATATKYHSRLL